MSLDVLSSSGEGDAVLVQRNDIRDYNKDNILPESPEILERIRSWLQPTSYSLESSEYHKHLASRLEGTGNWLTSSATYHQWVESDVHGMLWIKGAPGSGKSVLAAMLAGHLSRQDEGVPVLYFFFRQIVDTNRKPIGLIRDCLHQTLVYSPPLQKQLKEYVESGRSLESVSIEDLWQLLRNAFAVLPGRVYCFADALDEMDDDNDVFLRSVADLGQWKPGKVKVLITSRPTPTVEVPLRNSSYLEIRLHRSLVEADITTYVHRKLETSPIPPNN